MSTLIPTSDAEARAERIRSGASVVANWWHDVVTAYVEQDWRKLGHGSWEDYLTEVMGEHLTALAKPMRQAIASQMADAGMPTRAIAPALRVHHDTIASDLATVGKSDSRPPVLSRDGRQRPATQPPRARVTETTKTEYDIDTATGEFVESLSPESRATASRLIADAAHSHALAEWRQSFHAAIRKADDIIRFQPEVVAEKADQDALRDLSMLGSQIADYVTRVERATRGLRVVQGGQS